MRAPKELLTTAARAGIPLLTFLLTLAAAVGGLRLARDRWLAEAKAAALAIATVHGHALEMQLERSLSATYALAAVLRQSGGRLRDFDALATDLVRSHGAIAALQLAPAGVVRQIHPLKGNEGALGHDLLRDPARRADALAAIRSRRLVLSGPLRLVQGGMAVIGRYPVFLADHGGREHFWGFAIALIRLPDLCEAAGVEHLLRSAYDYELLGSAARPEVFARSSPARRLRDPVAVGLHVPGGAWELRIAPRGGWGSPFSPLLAGAGALLTALLFALAAGVLAREPSRLRRLVEVRTSELRAANEHLGESEARFRQLAENLHQVFWLMEYPSGRILYCSPAYETVFGRSLEALYRNPSERLDAIHPEDRKRVMAAFREAAPLGVFEEEFRILRPDGSVRWIRDRAFPVPNPGGATRRIAGITEDVTAAKEEEAERRRLEAQLQHTQRLESLGVLTGGIAHDFNNLLMSILGNADLALARLPRDSPARTRIEAIQHTAERAAELAGQMLAYAGKGRFVVATLDVSTLVEEMSKLLVTALSGRATLRLDLARDLPAVEGRD